LYLFNTSNVADQKVKVLGHWERKCNKKADDVKLYSDIAAVSSNTSVNITAQLNKVAKWASDWQLPIAYSKCCVFNIGSTIGRGSY